MKRRAVAPVPPPGRTGAGSPTTIDEVEARLSTTGDLERLPHIGPLVAAERPVIASWPANAPSRHASMNPTTASSKGPGAQLPRQLLSMIHERKRMLDRMVDPDVETQVVMQFGVLDECCKRLLAHFPSYRDVYSHMQDAVNALNHTFGTMLTDIDTLRIALNASNKSLQKALDDATEAQSSLAAELATLRQQCNDQVTNQDSVRVLSTQNVDLFEQLKKMKRKMVESDEISQHVSSRNVVLTVNQGRLENEVGRLNHTLETLQEHHDSDLKLLEHRRKAIEAMESRIESLTSRLEQSEANLGKANNDIRTMMDANRGLTELNAKLQQQLHQALESANRSAPSSHPTSRSGSPRYSSRGKRLSTTTAFTVDEAQSSSESGGAQTPRPDWGSATMLLRYHDERLVSDLKGLPSSRDRLRLLSQALAVTKQRLRAAEADVVAVSQRAAAAALVEPAAQPQAVTAPPHGITVPMGRKLSLVTNAKAVAPSVRRRVLESFSTAPHFTMDEPGKRGISSLHEYLNVPLSEVPRLEILPHEVSTICTNLFYNGLPTKLTGLLECSSSSVTAADDASPLAAPPVEHAATTPLQPDSCGSESAMRRDESTSDASRMIAPANRSFYMTMMSVAEEYIAGPLFKNSGLEALPLPPRVSKTEVAVRSLIRACQDHEATDAYSRLLLHCLADNVAPTVFLHFRKDMEKLRTLLISTKDPYATGRCDPLTFTIATKKAWPFCGELELDVIQRLAKDEQLASGRDVNEMSLENSMGAGPKRAAHSLGSGSLILDDDAPFPPTPSTGKDGGTPFTAPPFAAEEKDVPAFRYLDALQTTTSPIHQYLLHVFIPHAANSQTAMVEMLRGLAERNARPSEPPALGTSVLQSPAVGGAPVTTTVGTLLAAIQKLDPKRDKECTREYVALLLGRESINDVAPAAKCELTSLMDAARHTFFMRSCASEPGTSSSAGIRSPAPLPVIETKDVDEFIPPTPPVGVIGGVTANKQSMRRKSSLSSVKKTNS